MPELEVEMDINQKMTIKSSRPTVKRPALPRRDDFMMSGWPLDLEIGGWSESICARTNETREHVLYVAALTVKLARMAGIPECDIMAVRNGALLHDIGKIGIPAEILLKPASLTREEREVVHHHPTYGYDLLSPMSYLRPYAVIPYHHHERWDGSGYPQGLKGERIPLAARLFTVIDVWDSLSSDQVFRKAWPQDKVMDYIAQQSGKQFDPRAVDMFLSFMSDGQVSGSAGGMAHSLKKWRTLI
jgi:putative nucleotidyltransferase with HDIG domain